MYQVVKYNRPLRQFSLIKDYFNREEVKAILDLEKTSEFFPARLNLESDIDTNHRNSSVFPITSSRQNLWIFEKFSFILSQVNYDVFMYDIKEVDSFQFSKYEVGQFYNWHNDILMSYMPIERKISAIIMLSEKHEYTGGDLEIILDGNPENKNIIKLDRGDIFFFASWMPHRVTEVTSGVRKTLVNWVLSDRLS